MHVHPPPSRIYLYLSSITDIVSRESYTVYYRAQGLLWATEQIEKWEQGPSDQTHEGAAIHQTLETRDWSAGIEHYWPCKYSYT